MKSIIEYNENINSLIINDGSKQHSYILKLLMILNLLNAIIRIFKKNIDGFELYLWIFIGSISIFLLTHQYFKSDTSKEISITSIKHLKVKKVFGDERFSLILKNGRKRRLIIRENSSEIKNIIKSIGIKIIS